MAQGGLGAESVKENQKSKTREVERSKSARTGSSPFNGSKKANAMN